VAVIQESCYNNFSDQVIYDTSGFVYNYAPKHLGVYIMLK